MLDQVLGDEAERPLGALIRLVKGHDGLGGCHAYSGRLRKRTQPNRIVTRGADMPGRYPLSSPPLHQTGVPTWCTPLGRGGWRVSAGAISTARPTRYRRRLLPCPKNTNGG